MVYPSRRWASGLAGLHTLIDLQIRCLFGPASLVQEPQSNELEELTRMHRQLGLLHASSAHLPGQRFVTNHAVADTLSHCLNWLVDRAPLTRPALWLQLDAEVITQGNAYPQNTSNKPADEWYNTWLNILDVLDHAPYSRLLQSICDIVVKRCWLEQNLMIVNRNRSRDPSTSLCAMVVSRLVAEESSFERAVALSIWLKKLFAQKWNAIPIIQRSSTCYGILEVMRVLHNRLIPLSYSRRGVFIMRFLSSHLSVADLARAWPNTDPGGGHILQYRFLFATDQLYLTFRMINHLEMR